MAYVRATKSSVASDLTIAIQHSHLLAAIVELWVTISSREIGGPAFRGDAGGNPYPMGADLPPALHDPTGAAPLTPLENQIHGAL